MTSGPLAGVRVLDIATMLGAGHCTALLADFGADVIQVELPRSGDPLRQMGPFASGHSLRWSVVGRGKRSVSVDMRTEAGQDLVRRLAAISDVVVENFRPGTIDRWGLGFDQLQEANPGLILLSLSGYGQTGPDRGKPGFGRVIEAISGFMETTGEADGPPTQMGVPVVDYIAGILGAMAVSMALFKRERSPEVIGEWIDLSLYETMVRIMDAPMSAYSALGRVARRMGNRYPNVAPSDVYRTQDGRHIFHSSATQSVFERLLKAIGREDLNLDPNFHTNAARVEHMDEINDIVQGWFSAHDFDAAVSILEAHDVPVGPVRNVAEVARDPQLLERQSLVSVEQLQGPPLTMPGIIPKFHRSPGAIRHLGPAIGEHTDQVLAELLGLDPAQLTQLHDQGVI